MRALLPPAIGLSLILAAAALFLRSYTLPPAPDRRGGTTVMLTWPNRPLFGSPRADCLDTPESEPVIACLIASVNRAKGEGFTLFEMRFCATCYEAAQRIALIGRDEAAAQARLAQIARFGW